MGDVREINWREVSGIFEKKAYKDIRYLVNQLKKIESAASHSAVINLNWKRINNIKEGWECGPLD